MGQINPGEFQWSKKFPRDVTTIRSKSFAKCDMKSGTARVPTGFFSRG